MAQAKSLTPTDSATDDAGNADELLLEPSATLKRFDGVEIKFTNMQHISKF
jgi:hypothetical protein